MNTESPAKWIAVSEKRLLECRVFDVHQARSRSPQSGETHEFIRIVSADWVNVIPLTADGDVVMVRQFRHGSRDVTLEIPGGKVDPGETPEAAAARELLEETGYTGSAVVPLGSVQPNPALFDNQCHTYLMRDVRRVDIIRNEGAEETALEIHPLNAIPDLIRRGEITHSLVIAAFHWLGLFESGPTGEPS